MKATILQENLLNILKEAILFVPSSPPLLILENVLLTGEKNSIKAVATDLSIGIQKKTRAKIEKEGAVCVNAKNLLSFVSQLTPGKVEISLDKNSFILKTKNNQATFNTISPEDFPPLEESKEKQKTAKEELAKIANQVAFAAATEETRAVLTGVKLEEKEGKVRAVATDGFRLSIVTMKEPFLRKGKEETIIPARLFMDIMRIMPEEEIFVGRGKEKGRMVLSWADTLINVQLIEGKYPDFERIVPQQFASRAVIEKDKFEHLVRMAAVFARESANIVRLTLKKENIEVSANSPQIGSNSGRIAVKTEGEEQKIAFNHRFLLEFLKSAEGTEEIVFETSGPLKPGVFKLKGKPEYLHIIMPVRVQEEK